MEDKVKQPNTAHKSLKHFFNFHKVMEKNEVILSYAGDFSQELTKTLLTFTEKKFSADNLEDLARRKIFNIMVEMLQNISKNAVDKEDIDSVNAPLFLLGESEEHYFLITSNKINSPDIEKIKTRIDQVNSLDADGLKNLYKEVRLQGRFSEVGGAGIGFIDMARKSGNKLYYKFSDIDTGTAMYSLLIYVSKSNN